MMNRFFPLKFSTIALTVLVGCGGAGGELDAEEDADVAESAILNENALNLNALNLNALNLNALNPKALGLTALRPDTLSSTVLQALHDPGPDGELSRELLRYTVGCALDVTQSFSFSWTDAQGAVRDETYWGELGLAPGWEQDPLGNLADQGWVSACLVARVNWYDISVMISSRGAHSNLAVPGAEEIALYTVREGAFWGNLFGGTPYAYACHVPGNVDYARQSKRDCAAGHLSTDPDTGEQIVEPCGSIQIIGSCDAVCDPATTTPGMYYPKCRKDASDAATKTPYVITTYLD